jgi:hypothetical protein
VTFADLNDDDLLDMIVGVTAPYMDGVDVLLGTGGGTFGERVSYLAGTFPSFIRLADFNGDQHLDMAVVNTFSHSVSVFSGTGDGSFGTRIDYPTEMFPESAATGDLNGDGLADLVVPSSVTNTVSVYLGAN